MNHGERHHEKHHPDHVTQRCVPEPLETAMLREAGVEITYCLVRTHERGKAPLSEADCRTAEGVLHAYNGGDDTLRAQSRGRVQTGDLIFYARGAELLHGEIEGRVDDSEHVVVTERVVGGHAFYDVVVRGDDDFWVCQAQFLATDANRASVMSAGRAWLASGKSDMGKAGRTLTPRVAMAFLGDIGLVLWGPEGDQRQRFESELLSPGEHEAPDPGTPAWKLAAIADRLRHAGVIGPFVATSEAEVAFNPQPDPPGDWLAPSVSTPPPAPPSTSSGLPGANQVSSHNATLAPDAAKADAPTFNPQPDPPGATGASSATAPTFNPQPDPPGVTATATATDSPTFNPQPDPPGATAAAATTEGTAAVPGEPPTSTSVSESEAVTQVQSSPKDKAAEKAAEKARKKSGS